MFRRICFPFLFFIVALVGVTELAVGAAVESGPARRQLALLVACCGTLAAAAVVATAASLSRRLGRPLEDLVDATGRVGSTDDPPRVSPAGMEEAVTLGRVFNAMSARIAARISELEEDRHQLRAILSGMVEGVVALDAEQRVLYVNERASQLLEFAAPSPVGRRLWEVVRQRELLDVVRRALEGPEPTREEINWSGATARSLTVHAARLAGPPPRGAVLVLHDTSDLRRLERLRQEFVANVSHELKTPLSVIKACVETLQEGAAEDSNARVLFLQRIAEQGERLHSLILDLLSLARIEAGVEVFEFKELPVAGVVQACLERHRTRAEGRRQTLSISPDGLTDDASSEELNVWADQEALDQILDNLVDNALKYTADGGQVRISWSEADGQVCLEVSDTGIGIPGGDLARIFERFYRVEKARSREVGGTGLGLSIVKHLTQAMHGNVRATSVLGEGSTFFVCLPKAVP
jgi:two-component system, OmpR family, phosphate regulon sensor histidine kinase PhoR